MFISKTSRWMLLSFLLLAVPAMAQENPLSAVTAQTKPPEPAKPVDPLGRTNPRSTVLGFLQAAQSAQPDSAAQYFQASRSRRPADDQKIVHELKALMDRAFVGNINRITDLPEGTPQEGLSAAQERVGKVEVNDESVDLILTRVTDPVYGPIWVFSNETIAQLQELSGQLEAQQVETKLPQVLVRNVFLGLPLWQWIAILLLIPIATGAAWLFIQLVRAVRAIFSSIRGRKLDYKFGSAAFGPSLLIIATVLHAVGMRFVGLPLLARHYYGQAILVFFLIGLTWLTVRIIEWSGERLRYRAISAGRAGVGSLMLLLQRMVKVVVIFAGAVLVLNTVGFNLTTVLAGVGIGGIAVAFAAQKTLENLFGGVSVLGDEAIRVGDVCRFGATVGTIEDIGLRSTRVRTVERVELSIPNGSLATMNIENLSQRDKFLFNNTIGLRGDSTRDQLLFCLAEIRKLLYAHPKIEADGARIRLVGFGVSSFDLEIFCYIKTTNAAEFIAIREDILLRIMGIVESSGTSFANPARTVYFTRDPGMNEKDMEQAAKTVEKWREDKTFPFPDFLPAEISKLRGTIEYPPADSVLAAKDNASNASGSKFRPE
jgi:MscS family membrane protein